MLPRSTNITGQAASATRLVSDPCATCILRPGDPMRLGTKNTRAFIRQALARGRYITCHATLTSVASPGCGPAVCRGFFNACADRAPWLRARALAEVPPPAVGLRPGLILVSVAPGTPAETYAGQGIGHILPAPAGQVWLSDVAGRIWAYPASAEALIADPASPVISPLERSLAARDPARPPQVPAHVREFAALVITRGQVTVCIRDLSTPWIRPGAGSWQVSFVRAPGEEVLLTLFSDDPGTASRPLLRTFDARPDGDPSVATGWTDILIPGSKRPIIPGQLADRLLATGTARPAPPGGARRGHRPPSRSGKGSGGQG